ncbi:hypothetical protein D3C85_1512190 [compost metagenome]
MRAFAGSAGARNWFGLSAGRGIAFGFLAGSQRSALRRIWHLAARRGQGPIILSEGRGAAGNFGVGALAGLTAVLACQL